MLQLISCTPLTLFPFFRQMQQASQWWHDRQSYYLQQQADQIRDGLLQKLFTVRRSLELCEQKEGQPCSEERQIWVTEIEQVHRSLRHLSDQLFPSHLEESLPLAIRYELEQWKQQHPQIKLELDLPTQWTDESAERSRTILMILDELLRIALPQSPHPAIQEPIQICLSARNHEGELKISIPYPDQSTRIECCRSNELIHLSHAFQLLTSGWCISRNKGRIAAWSFRWRLL